MFVMPDVKNESVINSLPVVIQNLDVDKLALILVYHGLDCFEKHGSNLLRIAKVTKARALEVMDPVAYVAASVIEGLIKYYQNPDDPKLEAIFNECKKHLPFQDFMVRYRELNSQFEADYPKNPEVKNSDSFDINFDRSVMRAEYGRSFSMFLTNFLDQIPEKHCMTHLVAMRNQAYSLKTSHELEQLHQEMQPWLGRSKDEVKRRLDHFLNSNPKNPISQSEHILFRLKRQQQSEVGIPAIRFQYKKH